MQTEINRFDKEGRFHGLWNFTTGKYEKFSQEFSHGVQNGKYVSYYYKTNRVWVRGSYKNDKECGLWTYYKKNGAIKLTVFYAN